MVYFKDVLPFPGSHQLVILDDENQSIDKGTCLAVCTVIAAHHQHSNELIRNQKSSSSARGDRQPLNEDFLPTLGRRIIQGKARWGDVLQFAGYWEWTKGILSRCRHKLDAACDNPKILLILIKEEASKVVTCGPWEPRVRTRKRCWTISSSPVGFPYCWVISKGPGGSYLRNYSKAHGRSYCDDCALILIGAPRDLHSLAGLPLTRSLYDEVILSFEELTAIDQINNRFIPRSCKYLFHVSLETWIFFWSKKDMKYQQSPPRKEKKKTRPKSTHNPSSDFDIHQELCTFVLPIDDVGSIRPTTFKIASMMATGRKVSLGIPILTSIYKRLNKVSNFPRLTRVNYPFPVYFVYAWLEELNDLEERKRNLIALLDQQQQILQSVQVEVREIEEEITTITNTYSLSDGGAENLNIAMKQVEVAKEELESLKLFI
ncbi:hypothetical protein CDL12_24595 [Handroanthus impetiginosus]|uniref:Aminotransferase-like plant mobile domain-containing protein n=1 Tax=Handroanthus impetiginosus TaxID=429701 RepID=A0A2G9GC61_9LAMI|nr:hypothetical protein CDL12_24595 [Handroanthus impetiginosus]